MRRIGGHYMTRVMKIIANYCHRTRQALLIIDNKNAFVSSIVNIKIDRRHFVRPN